jgi:MYXO-CTERM domain-containing protein
VKRAFATCAVALVSLFAATDASAYVESGSIWQELPVTYKINQSTIPGSISGTAIASVDAGFQSWEAPTCTSFRAVNGGNTTAGQDINDGQNTILWRSDTWGGTLGDVNSTIGITMTSYSGNTRYDADIVFNDVGFDWDTTGGFNNVDTQSIATHEEGHFLGLNHTPYESAIMYAAYSGGLKRTLTGDDVQGVCALYPCSGTDCGTGAGGSGSGGSGGSGTGTGQTCATCQETVQQQGGSCFSSSAACGSSQDCVAYYDCQNTCNTQACVDGCAQQHPTGRSQFDAVIGCICQTGCKTECATDCDADQGTGGSTGTGGGSTTADVCGSKTGWVCDFVTSTPCGGGTTACDLSNQGPGCFDGANVVPVGGACDAQNGPFCIQGSTCEGGTCAKFCCSSAECPANNACQGHTGAGVQYGLCVPGASTGTGGNGTTTGQGGASTGGTTTGTGGSTTGSAGASGSSAIGGAPATGGAPAAGGATQGGAGTQSATQGTGGAATGGASAIVGGSGGSSQAAPLQTTPSSDSGGCGCRVPSESSSPVGSIGALALALVGLARRRKNRDH